mmetsp:Transcript_98218/g.204851  ORF Transcript_98218/g.204851 Transcript_98218/m.204851 type:complete len:389 (+) Transcript_98218:204-1370(+)
MNFYLLTAGYVVAGGLAVTIFIWGKADGSSFFDKCYRIVCVYLPRTLKSVLLKCCGPRGPAALDRTWDYLCYKTNPLVQIFYLFVVVGGYLVFVAFGYPMVTDQGFSSIHKYLGFVIFLFCVGTWWKACFTDPGIVTKQNVEDLCEFYKWDEQIFTAQMCQTCNLMKPARSKHCSLCNVCVAKFDHHCIWINSCVGVGNHKYFLLFLWWHLVICAYGCGMGLTMAWNIVITKNLFAAQFVDPVTQERKSATWLIVLQYMMATEGMILFVSILACVMGLVLFGFFLWHLHLVRVGTTTNELSKWNYVKWLLKNDKEEGGEEKLAKLNNIYNKGMFQNFKEVFIPVDVHKFPRQLAAESKALQADSGKASAATSSAANSKKANKGKTKKG